MRKSDRILTDAGNRLSLECFLLLIKILLVIEGAGLIVATIGLLGRYGLHSSLVWITLGAGLGGLAFIWFLHEAACTLAEIADKKQVIKITQRRSYGDDL
jgi:hypothetical protein